jgi:hypothetical protein
MPTLTEQQTFGDWLVMEGEKRYSRDTVTLLVGKEYKSGEVIGIVTASGKHTSYNQDGVDGTETAVGVLMDDADAAAADVEGVVIVRHAQVLSSALVWPSDIEAAEIITALGQLKVAGILGV